jgi:hypothetical protein
LLHRPAAEFVHLDNAQRCGSVARLEWAATDPLHPAAFASIPLEVTTADENELRVD